MMKPSSFADRSYGALWAHFAHTMPVQRRQACVGSSRNDRGYIVGVGPRSALEPGASRSVAAR